MALNNVDQILAIASTWEKYWSSRNRRINEWIGLEAFVDENRRPGHESMVTNDPATVMSLAVHLLSGQPIKHRVKVKQSPAAFEKAAKLERGLEGLWALVAEMAFLAGRDDPFRELAYWIALTGWYAVQVDLVSDGDSVLPIFDMHDPRDAYQEFGSVAEGLLTFVHKYKTTLGEAVSKARIHGGDWQAMQGDHSLEVSVVDAWMKNESGVSHTILYEVPNRQRGVIRHTEDLDLRHIPVLTGPVGGNPIRSDNRLLQTRSSRLDDTDDWRTRMGMSILEANRPIWKQYNTYLSLLVDIAKNTTERDYLVKGVEGFAAQKKDVGEGGHVYETDNFRASIEAIDPGRFPFQIADILNNLDAKAQRGGFPHVLFGGVNVDLSGFAISQLLQAALHRLGAHKRAMQAIVKQADRRFLEAFKQLEKSVTLSGRTHNTGLFIEKFDPNDVPTDFAIEPDIQLSMPDDMIERIAIVRQAIPGNEPVLDLLTALEDVLRVDDPKTIMDRIHVDRINQHPDAQRLEIIRAIEMRAKELDETGDADLAKMFRDYQRFLIDQAGKAIGSAPSARQGVPPNAAPSELTGISPNAVRAQRNPGAPNIPERLGLR